MPFLAHPRRTSPSLPRLDVPRLTTPYLAASARPRRASPYLTQPNRTIPCLPNLALPFPPHPHPSMTYRTPPGHAPPAAPCRVLTPAKPSINAQPCHAVSIASAPVRIRPRLPRLVSSRPSSPCHPRSTNSILLRHPPLRGLHRFNQVLNVLTHIEHRR